MVLWVIKNKKIEDVILEIENDYKKTGNLFVIKPIFNPAYIVRKRNNKKQISVLNTYHYFPDLIKSKIENIFYPKQFFKIWFSVKNTPMTVRENII